MDVLELYRVVKKVDEVWKDFLDDSVKERQFYHWAENSFRFLKDRFLYRNLSFMAP
jgi:hypothetical protein